MRRQVLNRFVPYIPVLLLSATSLILLIFRIISLGSYRLSFMAWNLLLAWLPLLFATLVRRGLHTDRWMSPKNLIWSFLWLAFLPNSFYMVTDLIHLRTSTADIILFDAVLLMCFALTGVIIGCISVYIVHRQLAQRIVRSQILLFLTGIFMLSSLAIYLGRYVGWNSWDLLVSPFYIVLDLSVRFTSTESLRLTTGTVLLFFIFISCTYTAFYSGIRSLLSKK